MNTQGHRLGGPSAASARLAQHPHLSLVPIRLAFLMSLAMWGTSCMITDVPGPDTTPSIEPTPQELPSPTPPEELEPTAPPVEEPTPGLEVISGIKKVANQTVATTRPITLETPFTGSISVVVQTQGAACPLEGDATLLVYQGEPASSQPLLVLGSSGGIPTCANGVLTFSWDTLSTPQAASAGCRPGTDDTFVLRYVEQNAEGSTKVDDQVTVQIDNCKPISSLYALCADAEGRSCLPLVETTKQDATAPGDLVISKADWKTLYVFGISEDVAFWYYVVYVIGPGASERVQLCQGGLQGNSTCTGEAGLPPATGYGAAVDAEEHETFDEDVMYSPLSESDLLLTLELDDAQTGSYSLQLLTVSETLKSDGAGRESNERFVTFFLTE